jgi:hypothetical protein
MLSAEHRARVQRQVETFTRNYRHAKSIGYNVTTMGLPSYETQQDFDRYQTHLAGSNYEQENEFIVEILKGLVDNGVPAKLVTIHHADFEKWLNGRENTSSNRASYCGHLIGEEERREQK